MSAGIQSFDRHHHLAPRRVATLLWICGANLVGSVAVLLLLSRLGLPLYFTYLTILIFAATTLLALAWMGRTMTQSEFFFADRKPSATLTGIGGATDWVSGAWLLLFAAASVQQRLLWVPSLMLGLLIISTLFSGAFYRSGATTLAGFFAWRYPRSGAGPLALLVTSVVLLMLAIAEFEAASRVVATIGVTPPEWVGWIILILAIFPILLGGWFSLILVNLVLAVWMTMAVLAPSLLLSLAPQFLALDSAGLIEASILRPLGPLPVLPLSAQGFSNSLISLFTLAAGFAVLPHAFSRLAMGQKPSAALEHISWAGFFVFVILTASGWSILLITLPSTDQSAALIANIPMIHILPYLAVLIAALNALAATLMVLSAGLVRGLLSTHQFRNSERAVFLTRLLVILFAAIIGWYFQNRDIAIGPIFVLALTLAGACFFVPLVAAAWFSPVPGHLCTGLIVLGAIIGGLEIWHGLFDGPVTFFANPSHACFASIMISTAVLLLSSLFGASRDDPAVGSLRGE